MKLEEQVTNLELAKKLKELGVKQDSLFYWVKLGKRITGNDNNEWSIDYKESEYLWQAFISAFTVAELGEMLPGIYHPYKENNNKWHWVREKEQLNKVGHELTEADARAAMLIYLLENKLISLR